MLTVKVPELAHNGVGAKDTPIAFHCLMAQRVKRKHLASTTLEPLISSYQMLNLDLSLDAPGAFSQLEELALLSMIAMADMLILLVDHNLFFLKYNFDTNQ